MATNTIELDPANAVESKLVTQLVGFKKNGTPTAVGMGGFMAERTAPKNSDNIVDFDLATETGIYMIAGNAGTNPVNSPLSTDSTYGILEVYTVTAAGVRFYTVQRFSNIIDKINCSVYQRVMTERGGFSPWVLISSMGG